MQERVEKRSSTITSNNASSSSSSNNASTSNNTVTIKQSNSSTSTNSENEVRKESKDREERETRGRERERERESNEKVITIKEKSSSKDSKRDKDEGEGRKRDRGENSKRGDREHNRDRKYYSPVSPVYHSNDHGNADGASSPNWAPSPSKYDPPQNDRFYSLAYDERERDRDLSSISNSSKGSNNRRSQDSPDDRVDHKRRKVDGSKVTYLYALFIPFEYLFLTFILDFAQFSSTEN